MGQLAIRGGVPLEGIVQIGGSKHSALAILGSSLLARGKILLQNVPEISDVDHMIAILASFGVQVSRAGSSVVLTIENVDFHESELWRVSQLRSSVLFLGSALIRTGEVSMPIPGGDKLGKRSMDEFLYVLEQFRIPHWKKEDSMMASLPERLHGHRDIDLTSLRFPLMGNNRTVLALMLAWANRGRTIIRNALILPEIIEVCDFLELISGGYITIDGGGTDTLVINSPGIHEVNRQAHTVTHTVGPDKCEYAFWIAAASLTSGDVIVEFPFGTRETRNTLRWLRAKLLRPAQIPMNVIGFNQFRVNCLVDWRRPLAFCLEAPYHEPYGIAFDAAPLYATILFRASGAGTFRCGHFGKERVRWAIGLEKIGAQCSIDSSGTLTVTGVSRLIAREPVILIGEDIRGASALLLLGLATEGEEVHLVGLPHILRGMERPIEKLRQLGAEIIMTEEVTV